MDDKDGKEGHQALGDARVSNWALKQSLSGAMDKQAMGGG